MRLKIAEVTDVDVLLPLVRRRSRREALERVADQGRLPPDVVARLRSRLGDDERPDA